MSTHRVDIFPINKLPHENADSLSIVRVANFTVVVRSTDWADGQLAAYIEPDMVVPANRPEFAFLAGSHTRIQNNGVDGYRIKVKRLRGVMSMGLLVPAPTGTKPGDNVMELLGVGRYEPPASLASGGECIKPPPGVFYKYDVENAYRYAHLFNEGEEVVCTEKVHGGSCRYVCLEEMFAGSRSEWKKKDPNNLWWKALANHYEVHEFCVENPGIAVYGEVYGQVQDLKYGHGKGEVSIVVFDLLRNGEWVDYDEAKAIGKNLPWVPEIYRGPWSSKVFEMADGKSILAKKHGADQIREGLVIKPVKERSNLEIGRTQLKIVSNAYLERA